MSAMYGFPLITRGTQEQNAYHISCPDGNIQKWSASTTLAVTAVSGGTIGEGQQSDEYDQHSNYTMDSIRVWFNNNTT